MNSTLKTPQKEVKNSQNQRDRRKITRDTSRAYFAICRAAGLEPDEARTAFAISYLCYDTPVQDADTPRKLALSSIGAALTSVEDDKKDINARWKRAQRHVSHLFCHALPRVGLQLVGRFKSVEDGKAHEYADHAMIIAGIVAEEFDRERDAILSSDRKGKAVAIDEAMQHLAREALVLFEPLDAAIVGPDRKLFAVVTAPQAEAFCEQNPTYKASSYTYAEPAEAEGKPKPFYSQDLDRIEDRIETDIEKRLDEIAARNSFDEARIFSTRLNARIQKLLNSWAKVAGGETGRRREEEELIHVSQNEGVGADDDAVSPVENPPDDETQTYDILSWVDGSNSFADNADENESLKTDPVENLSSSVNFDTALEAADFYIRDGFPVVPCCQFDPETGLCTGPERHQDDKPCKGKRPLIRGRKDAKTGDGYTAASRDRGLARDWFTRQFPKAGVAIRLDGHILIDCDVKDGAPGLESYQILADTFDLPETLSAVTPNGGRHHIFKLPDDLPADFLGSWTRVADAAELGGLDLKVGVRGLAHVEPSRGAKGVYRWIDPTFPPATLPRACCDYLREVHDKATQAQAESAQASASSEAQPFDPAEDQAKYRKNVPVGKRRPWLLTVARRIRARGADADQIKAVLTYHASHFKEQLDDQPWIDRVAAECVVKFKPEVSQ